MKIQRKPGLLLLAALILFSSAAYILLTTLNQPSTVVEMDYPVVARQQMRIRESGIYTVLKWNPVEADTIAIQGNLEAYVYQVGSTELHQIEQDMRVAGPYLSWSPDGQFLFVGSFSCWVWDRQKDEVIFEFHSPYATDGTFCGEGFWNPDSNLVAVRFHSPNSDGKHILFHIIDLNNLTVTDVIIPELGTYLQILGWGSDGQSIAVDDGSLMPTIYIIDYDSLTVIQSRQWADGTLPAWLAPDLYRIERKFNHRIHVVDTSKNKTIARLYSYSGDMDTYRWHPNGSHVVIAGEAGVWLWNFQTNVASIVQDEPARAIELSPDDSQLAVHIGSNNGPYGLQLFDYGVSELRIYDISELP